MQLVKISLRNFEETYEKTHWFNAFVGQAVESWLISISERVELSQFLKEIAPVWFLDMDPNGHTVDNWNRPFPSYGRGDHLCIKFFNGDTKIQRSVHNFVEPLNLEFELNIQNYSYLKNCIKNKSIFLKFGTINLDYSCVGPFDPN